MQFKFEGRGGEVTAGERERVSRGGKEGQEQSGGTESRNANRRPFCQRILLPDSSCLRRSRVGIESAFFSCLDVPSKSTFADFSRVFVFL